MDSGAKSRSVNSQIDMRYISRRRFKWHFGPEIEKERNPDPATCKGDKPS